MRSHYKLNDFPWCSHHKHNTRTRHFNIVISFLTSAYLSPQPCLQHIEEEAFNYCINLHFINVQTTIMTILSDAFGMCDALPIIYQLIVLRPTTTIVEVWIWSYSTVPTVLQTYAYYDTSKIIRIDSTRWSVFGWTRWILQNLCSNPPATSQYHNHQTCWQQASRGTCTW